LTYNQHPAQPSMLSSRPWRIRCFALLIHHIRFDATCGQKHAHQDDRYDVHLHDPLGIAGRISQFLSSSLVKVHHSFGRAHDRILVVCGPERGGLYGSARR
jgi:hypothetical protein